MLCDLWVFCLCASCVVLTCVMVCMCFVCECVWYVHALTCAMYVICSVWLVLDTYCEFYACHAFYTCLVYGIHVMCVEYVFCACVSLMCIAVCAPCVHVYHQDCGIPFSW